MKVALQVIKTSKGMCTTTAGGKGKFAAVVGTRYNKLPNPANDFALGRV